MEFTNKGKKFYINNKGNEIVYLDKKIPVVNNLLYTSTEASLVTNLYRIKFSKGILNIYLLETSELLDTYYKSSDAEEVTKVTDFGDTIGNFILKKDYSITLFKKGEKFFIKNKDKIEMVKDVIFIGLDTSYVTENANTLVVSQRNNNKFNGIPIGKITS